MRKHKNSDDKDKRFTIHCEWELGDDNENNSKGKKDENIKDENNNKKSMTEFFTERYVVYTRKYGYNWRGRVHHEPWPITDNVTLKDLSIQNIDAYDAPSAFKPLLRHFAKTPPDSVLYSSGVGPVYFDMLQPIQ